MNGCLASLGMNTLALEPGGRAVGRGGVAGVARRRQEMVMAPSALARVIAADRPRALNELVGLSDSSLMKSRSSPSVAPRRARVDQRREAFAQRHRLVAAAAAASARGTATCSARGRPAIARPARGGLEIVAGEQRQLAGGAEEWRSRGSNGPAPQPDAHSRW